MQRRRRLRQECTDTEMAVWKLLRNRRFVGFKFRRQHPVGPFIVDFYCARAALVLELDGGQHFEAAAQERDAARSDFLRSKGLRVVRFQNDEVLRESEAVMAVIASALGIEAA